MFLKAVTKQHSNNLERISGPCFPFDTDLDLTVGRIDKVLSCPVGGMSGQDLRSIQVKGASSAHTWAYFATPLRSLWPHSSK